MWPTLKRYVLTGIFIALLPLQPFSEEGVPPGGLAFKHITFQDGLVQSPITAMLQDRKGFVWIGSWKGLARYDGYEFRDFRHHAGSSGSISKGRVNAMLEDSQGELWIATANGLNLYHPETEQFDYFGSHKLKGGKNYVAGIVEDREGTIWVATFAGVYAVDRKVQALESYPLSKGIAYTLLMDNRQQLWVGTRSGVQRFDPTTKRRIPLPDVLAHHPLLNSSKVLIMREDKLGDLWFATEEDGLIRYQQHSERVTVFNETNSSLTSNMIKDMLFDRAGNLWIGTRGGISQLNPSTGQFINHRHDAGRPSSLIDNSVWSLMKDDENNLWVGTFSGSISYYSPNNVNFQHIGSRTAGSVGFENQIVHAIAATADDQVLWVGTFGGGLHTLDRRTGTIYHFRLPGNDRALANQHIKSLAVGPADQLWIGTLNGLFSIDISTRKFQEWPLPFEEGKLSDRLINCLAPSEAGIWVGANGNGLYFVPYDGSDPTRYLSSIEATALSDNFVNALLRDGSHGLWIGTQKGLDYLDIHTKKITKRFSKSAHSNLQSNDIQALFRDRHERMWIGTEGGGLYYFDERNETFFPLAPSQGITDDAIHAILEDQQGHIWISSDNGLFKIRFRTFRPPFTDSDVAVMHYTSQHGLSGNMYMSNAGFTAGDGNLFFGGINGLTSFMPEKIVKNEAPPRVVLTQLTIRNQQVPVGSDGPLQRSISETRALTLQYDKRYIGIRFAGINYLNPENNTYLYRLVGLEGENEWHLAGADRMAHYTNLSPGKYTFLVKAANSDGVWSDPYPLEITVLPPIWKTWWAYTLYALVTLSVTGAILRHIRSKELLKRDLHHEHQKLEFFTNISHEIRTPLTLITAPLDRLVTQGIDDPHLARQMSIMHTNANRLKKLVNELLDFRKVEHGKMKLFYSELSLKTLLNDVYQPFNGIREEKQLRVDWYLPSSDVTLLADRDQLEKVVTNLFDNAFKFTARDGHIFIRLSRTQHNGQSWIYITVGNETVAPNPMEEKLYFEPFWQARQAPNGQKGSGIGLALVKKIVELHHGTAQALYADGHTLLILSLPERPSHVSVDEVLDDEIVTAVTEKLEEPALSANPISGRILLAEDHAELRLFLQDVLSPNYEVIAEADGASAWESVLRQMPDLIISDVMMPQVDGMTLCERIKSDERTNHIAVILLTAKTLHVHRLEGLQRGADCYLTKPFRVQELELHIRNLLHAKNALRRKFSQQLALDAIGIEASTNEEQFVRKILIIVDTHIDDSNFGVRELAAEIGMSKSMLYDKMQAITGMPVASFIKLVRLQRAEALFRGGNHTIAEVAFSVGFTDRKYFSKEFRRQYGASPSEFIANIEVSS